jgi:hypothetical protein
LAARIIGGFSTIWRPTASGIRAAAVPCGSDCAAAARESGWLLSELTRTMQ